MSSTASTPPRNATTYPHPTGKLDIQGNLKRFRAPFAESDSDTNPADARLLSPEVGAGRSVCKSIAGLPRGNALHRLHEHLQSGETGFVRNPPSNPEKCYLQTNRPYSKIWFHTWGAAWSPRCEFNNESN